MVPEHVHRGFLPQFHGVKCELVAFVQDLSVHYLSKAMIGIEQEANLPADVCVVLIEGLERDAFHPLTLTFHPICLPAQSYGRLLSFYQGSDVNAHFGNLIFFI